MKMGMVEIALPTVRQALAGRLKLTIYTMLKFFRNIRKQLLEQGKTANYLKYAIGEIILVVIGILIALSINDWNDSRKQKLVDTKYFKNLKNDLIGDTERLDLMINYCDEKVKVAKKIMDKIKQDTIGSLYEFSNDMKTLLFVDEFRPDQSTYNEMKSSGNFSTIQNDTLKLKILKLQKTYIDIEALQDHMRYDFNTFIENFEQYVDWSKYFDLNKSNPAQLIFVYDSTYIEQNAEVMRKEIANLFRNKVFANNVFLSEINHAYGIDVLKKSQAQINEIINLLEIEIQN